ncbi:MAG TPA: aminoacetone oxidase family FAD-binding enzyme, partial [Verrucomicrobiae bacterium]|nr:aminoacetone oxidase family FAD-binding enzyme [Verrucomicrobiae bacterium]
MQQVIVVGGGAAGMMAAGQAALHGASVLLLEKTDRLGKKMAISGKGRCNITNAGDLESIIKNFPGNGNFLYGPLYSFTNQDLVEFLARLGVETKIERGQRIFPVSDDADQVVNAFRQFLRQTGVVVKTGIKVNKILTESDQILGVRAENGEVFKGSAVIVTTGGLSYPGTGSTGDGLAWARELGHTVVPPKPSLVPLETQEPWVKELQGLTLRNVKITAWRGPKVLDSHFGEMLFTHFGVSGPTVLSLSRAVVCELSRTAKPVRVTIDLKPALSAEQLDARLQRDFSEKVRKQFKNALDDLLPKSLIPVMVKLTGISPEKWVHQITREERASLGKLLKEMPLTIVKSLPIAAAIVTAGGVAVKEISPKT